MKKLEIGQTFEVVEVLYNVGSVKTKGNQGILIHEGMYNEVICYNSWYHVCYDFKCKVALMLHHEVKPIGRLIIKSIK